MTYVDGDDFNLTADEAEYALHLAQHVPEICQEAARICAMDDLALAANIIRLRYEFANETATLVDRVVEWFAFREQDRRIEQQDQQEGAN